MGVKGWDYLTYVQGLEGSGRAGGMQSCWMSLRLCTCPHGAEDVVYKVNGRT